MGGLSSNSDTEIVKTILQRVLTEARIPLGIKTRLGKLEAWMTAYAIEATGGEPFGVLSIRQERRRLDESDRVVYEIKWRNNELVGVIWDEKGNETRQVASVADPLCIEKIAGFLYLNRRH